MSRRSVLLWGLLSLGVLLGLFSFAVLGGWWWNTRRAMAREFKLVMGGTRSTSGDISVSGGNLVVVAPQPGVFFGTVKRPGEEEALSYVIIFRYDRSHATASSHGVKFRGGINGRTAHTTNVIELGDRRLDADYKLEVNEARTQVEQESLSIGGTLRDLEQGRVFLFDLSQPDLVIRQRKVELPKITPVTDSTSQVERLAEQIRQSLKAQDAEVARFLEGP